MYVQSIICKNNYVRSAPAAVTALELTMPQQIKNYLTPLVLFASHHAKSLEADRNQFMHIRP